MSSKSSSRAPGSTSDPKTVKSYHKDSLFSANALTAKDGSTVRRYGTPQLLLKSTVRLFCNGTGTSAFFVRAHVQYVGALFELKIPDFLHTAPVCRGKRQLKPTLNV